MKKTVRNVKSAKRLTSLTEIESVVGEMYQKAVDERPSLQLTERIRETDDGVQVIKATGEVAAESLPTIEELRKRAEELGIPWDEAYSERTVQYVASDERVDRMGDIVRQNWDFDNFSTNPLLLFGHEWENPPVGNILRWIVANRKSKDYSGPALLLSAVFATSEQSPVADSLFRLVRAGFMRTSSVGFFPKVILHVQDPEERSELGLGPWGIVFEESELVELSVCSVPANPGAHTLLMRAKKSGLLQPYDIQVIREAQRSRIARGPNDSRAWRDSDAMMCGIWRSLFPRVRLSPHVTLDEPLSLDDLRDAVERAEGDPPEDQPQQDAPEDPVVAAIAELRDVVESQAQRVIDAVAEMMPDNQSGSDQPADSSGGASADPALSAVLSDIAAIAERVKNL